MPDLNPISVPPPAASAPASIYDATAVEALRRKWRLDPHLLRQCRNAFLKDALPVTTVLETIPEPARAEFATLLDWECLTLAERRDSAHDGATKLAFRTRDGHLIETVILRIRSGRTSVCLSTQVGCAAGCAFCATGGLGFTRDLEAGEILDQVAQANRLLVAEGGTPVRNVVLMGMGEPFHNPEHVAAAITCLCAATGFNLSPAKIMVSTIGIPDAMRHFAARFARVHLAVSLHCAREAVRLQLMPATRHYPLAQLRDALRHITQTTGEPVMIEYLLLDGLTDTDADLAALSDFLDGIPAHLNLIPFNPVPGTAELLHPTPEARRAEFATALRQAGFTVTRRYSLGADIAGACGQLAAQQDLVFHDPLTQRLP